MSDAHTTGKYLLVIAIISLFGTIITAIVGPKIMHDMARNDESGVRKDSVSSPHALKPDTSIPHTYKKNYTKTLTSNHTAVLIYGINNNEIARRMAHASSRLIDEINDAYDNNRQPENPNKDEISTKAFKSVLDMWNMSRFKVTETKIERAGKMLSDLEFQLRYIPVYFEEEKGQTSEIAFDFDNTGKIIDVFRCLGVKESEQLLVGENDTASRRRQVILDFIEKFRTAYNKKDLELINKVFSENCLIITGRVIKQTQQNIELANNSSISQETVEYVKLSKGEYIKRLGSAFRKNEYINIGFESISFVKHDILSHVYGVTLLQDWKSNTYSDKGWLFLIIDFNDEDKPIIRARTWQPGILNGNSISKINVFELGDFKFSK